MSKFKRKVEINRGLAEDQVELLNEFYDVDMEFLVPAIQMALKQHMLVLTKAIVRGKLSIDEVDGAVVVTQCLKDTLESGETSLKYGEVGAKEVTAAELAKDGQEVWAIAASLTGLNANKLKKLHREDRKIVENLGNYFSQV